MATDGVEDTVGRQARRRLARGFVAVLIVAIVAGTGVGALWQPGTAAAQTIRGLSWYLDAMHVEDAHKITKGANVVVAVVDTGVDSSHPDLQGQVLKGGVVGDADKVDPHGDGREDNDGHGTGMASLIAGKGEDVNSVLGVAPEAKILPVRIAQTSDGAFEPSDVYEGVRWAIDHGAHVVNMSLGGEPTTDAPWKKELIEYAETHDVVLIAAAGNTGDGDKQVAEPAAIPGVVAVSGVKRDGTFWEGSASGPEVVVSAPADNLPMAAPRDLVKTGYVLADGTSGATALVSGVAALIRSAFPDLSAHDVVNRLIQTVEDRGEPGRDPQYGYGVVDARAALEGDVARVDHNPLISPEPSSPAPAVAGVKSSEGTNVVIVVSAFIGTTMALLIAIYLVSLARESRRVVLAGMAPGASPMQVSSDALWNAPPGALPGVQGPSRYPPPYGSQGAVGTGAEGSAPPSTGSPAAAADSYAAGGGYGAWGYSAAGSPAGSPYPSGYPSATHRPMVPYASPGAPAPGQAPTPPVAGGAAGSVPPGQFAHSGQTTPSGQATPLGHAASTGHAAPPGQPSAPGYAAPSGQARPAWQAQPPVVPGWPVGLPETGGAEPKPRTRPGSGGQDDSEYGGASVTQELPTVRDDEPPRRDTRPPWPPRPGR